MENKLIYLCDNKRHLICVPYSIENLHRMALDLNISRAFYHYRNRKIKTIKPKPHYDIPFRRMNVIMDRCQIVEDIEIWKIIKQWQIDNNI